MSRIAEICECSKPDSQKRCRISCGKPRYQYSDKRLPLRFSPNEELSEDAWERIQAIIQRHKDKME